MKTFLNVVGILALLGSMLTFLWAKSAVHEIEGCIALLLSCTALGFAKLIESQEQAAKTLAQISRGLTESAKIAQSSSSHAPFPAESLPPVPGKEVYYISDGVRGVGPYEIEKINALLAKGTITKETHILKQGTKVWQKLGAVFEL